MLAHEHIPNDCHFIIHEHLPCFVIERCNMCGSSLIMQDKRGRLHYDDTLICTENYTLCLDCYDDNYSQNS